MNGLIWPGTPAHHVNGDDDRLRGEAGDRAADAVADRRRLGRRQLRPLAESAARRLHHLQRRQVHLGQEDKRWLLRNLVCRHRP